MFQIDRLLRPRASFTVVLGALLGLVACASPESRASSVTLPATPEWARDLVIYEIATKGFTSPNGPESGTFASLSARLPYLQELGITGIWLTGHSLSDPRHFYNIWTQYAAIEPDKIDPSLGTPEQFKAMIDEAHRRGIKVFLDVITHGVMPSSSLVKRHPQWFRGSAFGMMEYDWYGGHTDLDDWWVQIWTDYVIRYGVDGFRLDVDMQRTDLWSRIRQNATAAGRSIVIFPEHGAVIPGVTDFKQNEATAKVLSTDVPRYFREKFGRAGNYDVEILYADGAKSVGTTEGGGGKDFSVRLNGLVEEVFPRMDVFAKVDGIPDVQLLVTGSRGISTQELATRPIRDIIVTRKGDGTWWSLSGVNMFEVAGLPVAMKGAALTIDAQVPDFRLNLPTLGHGISSVLLSCHDYGWAGAPLDKNPYVAQGSRALFGYAVLFAPMIPIFMAGEEFDANYHALPTLSPDLYGGKNPGKGRWLYGSMLNWDEIDQPRHRAMFEDVKRMLAIRAQERAVLAPAVRGDIEPQLVAVPHTASTDVPAPYMRWNNNVAIIVMANRHTDTDVHLNLQIPIDRLGNAPGTRFRVSDLWNRSRPRTYSASDFVSFPYAIKRDKTPGGGIGVLKIEIVSMNEDT